MKKYILLSLLTIVTFDLLATSPFQIREKLNWDLELSTIQYGGKTLPIYSFTGAQNSTVYPSLPVYSNTFLLDAPGSLDVQFTQTTWETFDTKGIDNQLESLGDQIEVQSDIAAERRQYKGTVWFVPIRKNPQTGQLERLTEFVLNVSHKPGSLPAILRNGPSTSMLANGSIYKIGVPESGLYKLTYSFLKDELGIDIDNINPNKIKLIGNGGGMLPERNSDFRYENLQENAILIQGGNDGSFDSGDYILFYGQGPNVWNYSAGLSFFTYSMHLYDTENHYFIKIDESGTDGLRINSRASISGATYSTSEFDARDHVESDEINLLDNSVNTTGSGKDWYGESFKFTTSRDYSFSFPQIVSSTNVRVRGEVAGRSSTSSGHTFQILNNGTFIAGANLGAISGNVEETYAQVRSMDGNFTPSGDDITLTLEYNKPTSVAEAWLDYLTVNARQQLNYSGRPLYFRDKLSTNQNATEYNIAGANGNTSIWDITNPLLPIIQEGSANGNTLSFAAPIASQMPREFIAFEGNDFPSPTAVGAIPNQNLHSMPVPDMVIFTGAPLAEVATRLKNHRESVSNLTVEVVILDQVYNEFSTGNQDLTALRDFTKFLYDQDPNKFKYVLLFGDASFDYRNIRGDSGNEAYVPTFETSVSNHPIRSFPTDDFFGLLDDNEGVINTGFLDIGVGRIPANSITEANQTIDKIVRYETSQATLGDWKNRLVFNADDEDNNLHFRDANLIADLTGNANQVYNLEKIYFDAFRQVSTPGGNRYPEATKAIDDNIFKGSMVVNYMGHGGASGWAQERVLTSAQIAEWSNSDKLPLFVTATCTFGPYDEPTITSAGELLVLKPDGGAIALFTTVRAVFASLNADLTESVFRNLFEPVNGEQPTLGEILRVSKNALGLSGVENSRKFVLLGDPSMKLAVPPYQVFTSSVNGSNLSTTDTLRALQDVTITGYIADPSGNKLENFNGIVYPTVFDKRQDVLTLGNDPGSFEDDFKLQKSVIFKGRATVNNGDFTFSFTMPSDINFTFGNGKISYYAEDGTQSDATGFYDNIIIGGSDTSAVADDEPPLVELFMNDEAFAFGGLTDQNPVLLAKLSDDKGINTVGNGIGHDITAILDENTQNTFILNEFYESELDNSTRGTVNFPLFDLEEGRHTIRVKAWDISNNSGEDVTEFVVASSAEIALENVLNYPNPFTTSTNFQFEHNLPSRNLRVLVQIYTVSGRLVKTIDQDVFSEGFLVNNIHWDGLDDYGNKIGRGVYLYKISLGSFEGEMEQTIESEFEKLVILR